MNVLLNTVPDVLPLEDNERAFDAGRFNNESSAAVTYRGQDSLMKKYEKLSSRKKCTEGLLCWSKVHAA